MMYDGVLRHSVMRVDFNSRDNTMLHQNVFGARILLLRFTTTLVNIAVIQPAAEQCVRI